MSKAIFDAARQIKGGPLTQADVDLMNRAIACQVITEAKTGRNLSPKGEALIHSYESFQAKAYRDPGSRDGLPITIGWGSTSDEHGAPIKLGTVWTLEQANRKFRQDIAAREIALNALLQGKPTTQNQFDALLSFAYNVGLDVDADNVAEGLGDSTLLRKHLAGDYAGAKAEFAKWNKNDGKVMAGLTRRRAEEAALYGA